MNPQFVDAEAYQGGKGEDLTIQAIIMQHVQRITRLASTEWHGGFWYTIGYAAGGNGPAIERYMPAANEAYSNAVDCLADLLAPFFDEDMLAIEASQREQLEALRGRIKQHYENRHNKNKKSTWYDYKVEIQRPFFREMIKFIQRAGLMTGGSYEEEVVG